MAVLGNISGLIQATSPSQETGLYQLREFAGNFIEDNIQFMVYGGLDTAVPYAIQFPPVPVEEIFDGIHAVGCWNLLDKTIFAI